MYSLPSPHVILHTGGLPWWSSWSFSSGSTAWTPCCWAETARSGPGSPCNNRLRHPVFPLNVNVLLCSVLRPKCNLLHHLWRLPCLAKHTTAAMLLRVSLLGGNSHSACVTPSPPTSENSMLAQSKLPVFAKGPYTSSNANFCRWVWFCTNRNHPEGLDHRGCTRSHGACDSSALT